MANHKNGSHNGEKFSDSNLGGITRPLRGVVTPLVTPLSDRDSIDHEGLERLLEHVLSGGVHGVFLLGTTGEAAALSMNVQRDLVRSAVKYVGDRVPILVGVSHNSIVESLRLARDAAEIGGVGAIVVTTPSFLPVDQDEMLRYIQIFDRESPLPVMLYNMPRLTSHWFSVEIVRQAMQLENVIGLKDSSGDMNYFTEVRSLLAQRADWSLFTGPENLLADAVKLGAHGCVGGGSNLWPQLLVDIYQSAMHDDQPRIQILQELLQKMNKIYQFGTYATGVIRGLKCGLEMLGICSSRMAEPFGECSESQRAEIERHLLQLGLLVGEGPYTGTQPLSPMRHRSPSIR